MAFVGGVENVDLSNHMPLTHTILSEITSEITPTVDAHAKTLQLVLPLGTNQPDTKLRGPKKHKRNQIVKPSLPFVPPRKAKEFDLPLLPHITMETKNVADALRNREDLPYCRRSDDTWKDQHELYDGAKKSKSTTK